MDMDSSLRLKSEMEKPLRFLWGIILLALVLLPLAFQATPFADYLTYTVARMMIFGLYAMSYDLLFGYTGIFSFGHATFWGCGGYSIGILMVRSGWQVTDAFPGIILAMVIGAGFGWAMGFLCSRVGPVAIFLVTFAFTQSLQLLAFSDPLKMTNAEDGITGIPRETFLGLIPIKSEMQYYYFVLAILVLSFLVLTMIIRRPLGDVFVGIRENPLRVRFLGYHVRYYRIVAFMISGAFASLAGALTTLHERAVAPEMLSWFFSGDAVLFTVLGGPGTLIGPLLGAAIVVIFQEILSDIFRNWLIFLGISYIILIMFLPKGLFPLFQRMCAGQQKPQAANPTDSQKA